MVRIKATPELIESLKNYLSIYNLGNRGVHDGNKQEQLIGLISECIVIKYLTGKYPNLRDKPNGFDGGYDIELKGIKIDVKTRGSVAYMQDDYMHNVFKVQVNHNADVFIFCNYNRKTDVVEICGWISKQDFLQKAVLYPKGTIRINKSSRFTLKADNYEIENQHLKDIKTL